MAYVPSSRVIDQLTVEPTRWQVIPVMVATVISMAVGVWLAVTFIEWAFVSEKKTLVQILKEQYVWLIKLSHRIY